MRIDGNKREFFEKLMQDAKTHPDYERQMTLNKRNIEQYNGSKKIDPVDDSSELPDDAIVVRNITRELIESQKDMRIPAPKVTPRISLQHTDRNAKATERLLNMLRDKLPFERLNNTDEFYAPTLGATFYLVEFDNSVRTHFTVGEGKVSIIDPSDIIPQPGIYDVNEMEYIFIRSRMTREDIMRTYGVPLRVAEESDIDPEDDDVGLEQYNVVTVYTCFWRNESGAVCKYVWSGDTELQDVDDYYARKKYICRCCGKRKELCEENPCSDPDYEMQDEDYEELTEDIILPDYAYEDVMTSTGAVIKQRVQKKIPAFSPVYKDGEPVMEEADEPVLDETGEPVMQRTATGAIIPQMHKVLRPKTAPTRLPYYKPKRLPVICRRNVSIPKSLYGQSDCEVIRPQQQEINKLESRIHEKLMRSGAIEFHRKGVSTTISNGIFDQSLEVPEGSRGTALGASLVKCQFNRICNSRSGSMKWQSGISASRTAMSESGTIPRRAALQNSNRCCSPPGGWNPSGWRNMPPMRILTKPCLSCISPMRTNRAMCRIPMTRETRRWMCSRGIPSWSLIPSTESGTTTTITPLRWRQTALWSNSGI